MRLSEIDIKAVARRVGVGEKAISRLIASLRIGMPTPANTEEGEEIKDKRKELDLGLRLQSAEILTPLILAEGKENVILRVSKGIREYFLACPNVCAWVGRGDFRADKIPDNITKGMLLHANRTAGRLRAKVLRSQ